MSFLLCVAQGIVTIPAHIQQDNVRLEMPPLERSFGINHGMLLFLSPGSEFYHFLQHNPLDDSSPRLPSDNSRYQEHTFKGVAGKTVTITMESSDFETFLIVRAPNGQEMTSDRSQTSNKSTVTIPSCTTGTYSIHANARYIQGQGRYVLNVRTVS